MPLIRIDVPEGTETEKKTNYSQKSERGGSKDTSSQAGEV